MVNWSEHTKRTLPFNCSNIAQDKTKVRKVPIDEGQGAQAPRLVRRVGLQGTY